MAVKICDAQIVGPKPAERPAKRDRAESSARKRPPETPSLHKGEKIAANSRCDRCAAHTSDSVITGTRTQPPAATGGSTNQFFDEQSVALDTTTGDKELVAFLLALGAGDSMIRVRDLDLRTDPQLYKLLGKLTLVASYQKKPKIAPPPAVTTNVMPARPGPVGARAGATNRAAAPQPVKLNPAPPGRPVTNNVTLTRTNRLKS